MKFLVDMLNYYDFIQVFIFTTNHHLNEPHHLIWLCSMNPPLVFEFDSFCGKWRGFGAGGGGRGAKVRFGWCMGLAGS